MTKIALGDEYIILKTSTPSTPSVPSTINFGSMSGSVPSGGGYSKTSTYINVPETLYFVKLDSDVQIRCVQIVTSNYTGTSNWTLFGSTPSNGYTATYNPFYGTHFSGIVPAARFERLLFALNNQGDTGKSITIKIFPLKYFMALANSAHL